MKAGAGRGDPLDRRVAMKSVTRRSHEPGNHRRDYRMGRFASTVAYYASARPPYGAAFFAAVARDLEFDRSQRLIDVGAGPGLLTIGFAPACGKVVCVDPGARDMGTIAVEAAYAVPVERLADRILSMSTLSPERLGDEVPAMRSAMREALARFAAAGVIGEIVEARAEAFDRARGNRSARRRLIWYDRTQAGGSETRSGSKWRHVVFPE